jgi:hypothetical protein
MKKLSLIACLTSLTFCLPAATHATEIYISIDENGNRIFSDVPNKESRTHKIKEISTIPAIKIPQRTSAKAIAGSEAPQAYESIQIISPLSDSHLHRGELGNFVVTAQLSPALQEQDEAVLLFDGQELSSGHQLSWQINNADRGTHTLRVIVRHRESKIEKISSPSQSIHVRR